MVFSLSALGNYGVSLSTYYTCPELKKNLYNKIRGSNQLNLPAEESDNTAQWPVMVSLHDGDMEHYPGARDSAPLWFWLTEPDLNDARWISIGLSNKDTLQGSLRTQVHMKRKRKPQEMLDTRNLDTGKTKRSRREEKSFSLLSRWMLGYFEMQCLDMETDVRV